VQILIGLLLVLYSLVAPVLFWKWLELMMGDRQQSRRERILSKWIVIIATIFWPIVLPLTYLELLERVRHREHLGG
jgi:heme/copper-type cytochrome/quinol oxidase subunit 2